MTLATESPRMAPLHAAARRAVEYMDDRAPMLDADTSLSQYMERPSLLAYNRPLAKPRFAQQHQPQSRASQHMQQYMPYRPSQRDTTSRPSTASTDDESMSARLSEDRASWYTSDEDSPYHDHPFAATPPLPFHEGVEGDDEEESKDEERTDKADDDDHVHLLEAPRPADVPLLEIDEEEPEQEVDTILGDLTRLPRTTIIDEDGFLVDPRASLSHPAANGAMGLGVSRPGMIIKSGLLFKQGFAFMNGGWKVRHAELTTSKLTFFKGEHGRKRGVVDLATCSPKSIEIMPRDSVFDGSQATMWRFAIKTKGRRVMVSAYSEADMKEWLRCLHVALAVQSSGAGRLTDFVVPNGTLLANKGDGLMRASGSGFMG